MKWRVDYEYQDRGATFFGSMVCEAPREQSAKLMIGSVITKARPGLKELYMRANKAEPLDMVELGLTSDVGPGRMD